jgi:hypothetical protein
VDWILGFLLAEVNSYPLEVAESETVAYVGKVMLALITGGIDQCPAALSLSEATVFCSMTITLNVT